MNCQPIPELGRLARIIHERFYCNGEFAAATSQHTAVELCWRTGSPLSPSTYCFKYALGPRVSARPSRDATSPFRHESS
jgi:hypothetical protein